MALGAQLLGVLALVIRQGLLLAVTGMVTGLVVSFALTRWLATLLFGISATDAFTLVSVASLFTFVAFVACYLPAWRAMKMDPVVALALRIRDGAFGVKNKKTGSPVYKDVGRTLARVRAGLRLDEEPST